VSLLVILVVLCGSSYPPPPAQDELRVPAAQPAPPGRRDAWALEDGRFGEDFFLGDSFGGPAMGVRLVTPSFLGPIAGVLHFEYGGPAVANPRGSSQSAGLVEGDLTLGLRVHAFQGSTSPLRTFFDIAGGVVEWEPGSSSGSWIATLGVGEQFAFALTSEHAPPLAFVEFSVSILGPPPDTGSPASFTEGVCAYVGFHVPD